MTETSEFERNLRDVIAKEVAESLVNKDFDRHLDLIANLTDVLAVTTCALSRCEPKGTKALVESVCDTIRFAVDRYLTEYESGIWQRDADPNDLAKARETLAKARATVRES